MDRADLLKTIERASSLTEFVEKNLLSRVPWIFSEDEVAYREWRDAVAREAKVSADGIYIVGSAATGYSLSPLKPGRGFRVLAANRTSSSDVDVAVVDPLLFEGAWETIVRLDRIRGLGRPLSKGVESARIDRDRMRLNVYWGTISQVYAVLGTTTSRILRSLKAATTRRAPFVGYEINVRIYRRRLDLQSYHEQSLKNLLKVLRQKGSG
jgi:predicted nucleotidyltransferase